MAGEAKASHKACGVAVYLVRQRGVGVGVGGLYPRESGLKLKHMRLDIVRLGMTERVYILKRVCV